MPQILGIINCTPDSYYEKGRFTCPEEAIAYALELIEEGADILDIGGESTRPGATPLSAEEELKRVLPVIKGIRRQTSHPLSIDTFKPEVAEAALDEGVNWINDITGFSHPQMRTLARISGAQCCVMHMPGPPHTLPTFHYPLGVVEEIFHFFTHRTHLLLEEGILPSQIILDPGIGGGSFGKTPEHCLHILQHLRRFHALGYPLLLGISRKSFMQKILQKPASELLSTTLALNTMALQEGTAFLRVHDVAAHRNLLNLFKQLN